ncbi:V-set and immunoglobulin domain-containing protein 2-like [Megalops cyprinoides]|uniref:V-set and immunoglobulin domain-containing protein 2-like n=1 Tax=Megalops cyprinoides TaxID=118141 RepID=UPI001863DD11|nr:V-set and immunoglobulin domain-containing protein 2-like [Megalops cyprinoides]
MIGGVVSYGQPVQVRSPIFARVGESTDLPCTYSTSATDGFTLEWRYAAPGTPAIQAERLLYYNGNMYWVGSDEDRMALVQNPPVQGTATLRISNLQPSDTGLYICDVTNPDDWSGSGQGLINLSVLVPPSVPTCRLNGQAYVGSDVVLTCQALYGLPVPIYSWSREKNAAPISLNNMVQDPRTGTLLLRNLSAPFTGKYTCTASNALGSATCTVTIRVLIFGATLIIGGAVMGTFIVILLIAAVLTYFIWCKKRRTKQAQEKSEMREESKPPSYRSSRRTPENAPLRRGASRQEHPELRPSQFSFVV